jgi:hypothetical protein
MPAGSGGRFYRRRPALGQGELDQMASSTRKNIKEKLLLLFVLISILLVGIIWAEGLTDSPPATPSYYLAASSSSMKDIYLTATAEMHNNIRRK